VFADEPNGGLIVLNSVASSIHHKLITDLAARLRLPAIYPYRFFVADGGLVSYGVDNHDLWQKAAGYVDRILKGAKPAELPVQEPTKFELAINLKRRGDRMKGAMSAYGTFEKLRANLRGFPENLTKVPFGTRHGPHEGA
jgi:hypothetical protein